MRKNVLIATLGMTAGPVTTSVDLLLDWQGRGFKLDRLVVLMTAGGDGPEDVRGHCYERKADYRQLWRDEGSKKCAAVCTEVKKVMPNCECVPVMLNVTYGDLYCWDEVQDFFRLCLVQLLRHTGPPPETTRRELYAPEGEEWIVFVSISGGRKSMSALLLLAAAVTGQSGQCFQAVVPWDIEKLENDDSIQDRRTKAKALHPGDEAWRMPLRGFGKCVDWQRVEKAIINDPDALGSFLC